MNVSDAVNKPKFHHQWLPDILEVEDGFSPEVITGLRNIGYHVEQRGALQAQPGQ